MVFEAFVCYYTSFLVSIFSSNYPTRQDTFVYLKKFFWPDPEFCFSKMIFLCAKFRQYCEHVTSRLDPSPHHCAYGQYSSFRKVVEAMASYWRYCQFYRLGKLNSKASVADTHALPIGRLWFCFWIS